MIFKKHPLEIIYDDIEALKTDKIEESEILDYKEELIAEKDLLKEITAFANSSGGYIIFGVTETGNGGYPKEIKGIENNSNLNLERLEQIILSNIYPRIGIQFSQKIPVPNTNKIILVIKIPEGQNRPYLESKSSRYYKRYNFEAKPMDENEIETLYQNRFFGMHKIDRYITEVISDYKSKLPKELAEKKIELIIGNIFITPLNIDKRIFDTGESELLKSIPSSYLNDSYLRNTFQPSRYGVKSEYNPYCDVYCIELHRNGLIHNLKGYGNNAEPPKDPKEILIWILNRTLLKTILFANDIHLNLNFYGKVRIILRIENTLNSYFKSGYVMEKYVCKNEYIYVEREWDSWDLANDYLKISKSIMDEVVNHFGVWKAPMYNEKGELTKY
jgi:hypothetical protein